MAPGFTVEIACKVAPARMFKAWCMDIHNLAPKVLPKAFSRALLRKGDGGVGTVKLFNFTEALPYSYMEERVVALDKKNFECKYTITKGGDLGKKISFGVYHFKLEPSSNGGCVFMIKGKYHMIPGVDAEKYIKVDKKLAGDIVKAVEALLIAHPDAYA